MAHQLLVTPHFWWHNTALSRGVDLLYPCFPIINGLGKVNFNSFCIKGRVLKGIGSSIVTANCTTLVSKYSSQSRRGPFLSFFTLMKGLGKVDFNFLCIKGRVVKGIGGATVTANCTLLVAQYSSQSRRGPFLSLFPLMIGLGKVDFIYLLGNDFYYCGLYMTFWLLKILVLFFIILNGIRISSHRSIATATYEPILKQEIN